MATAPSTRGEPMPASIASSTSRKRVPVSSSRISASTAPGSAGPRRGDVIVHDAAPVPESASRSSTSESPGRVSSTRVTSSTRNTGNTSRRLAARSSSETVPRSTR